MRKGARRPEWTPHLLYVIIWRGLQMPHFVFDGWACLGRTAALCGWGGFPVGWVLPSCSQGHLWNVHTAARSVIIFLAIYGSVMFCFLLSLSLFTYTHTRTHTLWKDKGALPRVPPTTLSHVISVLTYSDICSIKTSPLTVLISYWQREVNVPILPCFNWLDENFQTLLMSYNLISTRASLH